MYKVWQLQNTGISLLRDDSQAAATYPCAFIGRANSTYVFDSRASRYAPQTPCLAMNSRPLGPVIMKDPELFRLRRLSRSDHEHPRSHHRCDSFKLECLVESTDFFRNNLISALGRT